MMMKNPATLVYLFPSISRITLAKKFQAWHDDLSIEQLRGLLRITGHVAFPSHALSPSTKEKMKENRIRLGHVVYYVIPENFIPRNAKSFFRRNPTKFVYPEEETDEN